MPADMIGAVDQGKTAADDYLAWTLPNIKKLDDGDRDPAFLWWMLVDSLYEMPPRQVACTLASALIRLAGGPSSGDKPSGEGIT